MIRIAATLARAGGGPRMLLVGTCTAAVCALLLVAITILRLPPQPAEPLFELVADPGLRGGTTFATVLLTVPALLLLYQAVRLGTASRERRLAALRLAGATPGEIRVLGAIEVAVPAFAGSLAGVGIHAALRGLFADDPAGGSVSARMRLVPTSVTATRWQVCLVVVGVTALGVVVGLLASRRVVVTPLGITRRQAQRPPRPWGLLLLAAAVIVVTTAVVRHWRSEVAILTALACAVLGIVSLAPWVAYRVGRYTVARTASPTMFLAASRVVAEPRPVGRAAAAVGGLAMIGGGAGGVLAGLLAMGQHESFYFLSLALVAVALLGALLAVLGTLAVHSVESLLDRKRSTAALCAFGASPEELEKAQFAEAALVAIPMAALGVLLGSLPYVPLLWDSPLALLVIVSNMAVTLGLVWLAILIAVRITRPWAAQAGAVGNLRTE